MGKLLERCKAKTPFIIIIESEYGFRFGGYSNNGCKNKYTGDSFIFSLT